MEFYSVVIPSLETVLRVITGARLSVAHFQMGPLSLLTLGKSPFLSQQFRDALLLLRRTTLWPVRLLTWLRLFVNHGLLLIGSHLVQVTQTIKLSWSSFQKQIELPLSIIALIMSLLRAQQALSVPGAETSSFDTFWGPLNLRLLQKFLLEISYCVPLLALYLT